MLRYLTITLILSCAMLLTGCTGVAWLHDSSGFLFVRGNTLIIYDVDEQSETEILSEDWLNNMLHVGVSPNDERIAIVKIDKDDESFDFQVFIYDMQGALKKKSPVLSVPFEKEEYDDSIDIGEALNYAEWSPDGKKILYVAATPEGEHSAVLDLKSNTIQLIQDVCPPFYMNGYSCSPDSKGFIALKDTELEDESEDYVYVEWNGTIHEIDDREAEAKNDAFGASSDFMLYPQMRWNENILSISLENGNLLQVDIETKKAELTNENKSLYEHAQRFGVTNVHPFSDGLVLQATESEIQVARIEEGTRETLVMEDDLKAFMYSTSPDGRRVVIATEPFSNGKLLVIDSDGNLVAELER
jgi:hypothetical protein